MKLSTKAEPYHIADICEAPQISRNHRLGGMQGDRRKAAVEERLRHSASTQVDFSRIGLRLRM